MTGPLQKLGPMLNFVELDYKVSTELPELESRVRNYSSAVSQSTGPDAVLESQGAAIKTEIEGMLMMLLETKMHLQGVSPSVDDAEAPEDAQNASYTAYKSPLENVQTMQRTLVLNNYIEEYVGLKQLLVKAQLSLSTRKLGGEAVGASTATNMYDRAAKVQELVARAANLQNPVTQLKNHQLLLRDGLAEDAKLLENLEMGIDSRIAGAHVATGHARDAALALCRHHDCKFLAIAIAFTIVLIVCIIWL